MGRSKRKTPASAGGKKPVRPLPAVTVVRQLQNKQQPPRAPAANKSVQSVNKTRILFTRKFPPVYFRPVKNLAMLSSLIGSRQAKAYAKLLKKSLKNDDEDSSEKGSSSPTFAITRANAGIHLISSSVLGDRMSPSAWPSKPLHVAGGPANTGLSSCAVWYAKALTNPFGQFEELPCIPSSPAVPSYRYRAFTRGQFSTSTTTGVGFCMVSPYVPNAGSVAFYASGGGYTGTAFANGGVGVVQTNKVLPFVLASFSGVSVIQGKLVGAGLRVRNITQALNVGGILFGVEIPSDGSLQTLTQAMVTSYPGSISVPQVLAPSNEWSVQIVRPWDVTDLDYNDNIGGVAVINANANIGFLAIAPQISAQQLFEFEYVEFWEFIGTSSATGERVPEFQLSHADVVGLDRVTQAAQEAPNSLLQRDLNMQMAEGIAEAIAHSDSTAKTVEAFVGSAGMAVKAVTGIVSSLVSLFAL